MQGGQWHTRENVVSYLPKTLHVIWRRTRQTAYASDTDAKRARQQLVADLGTRFTTTNLIERVLARVEAKTHRVGRWRMSDQQQRWCAATLIHSETNFRRVKGYTHLALLHATLRGTLPVNTTAAEAAIPRHSPEFQRSSGHAIGPPTWYV